MAVKVYEYKGCGTCKKALKFLESQGVNFEQIPVREQPPTKDELERMLAAYEGNVKKLFNTSGKDYREQKLGAKLADMSTEEAFQLLMENGNLVKRPFVLTDEFCTVGFKEETWQSLFN